jgi:hypothetical protein
MFSLILKTNSQNITKYKLRAFKSDKWSKTLNYILCEYVLNVDTKIHLFFSVFIHYFYVEL